MNFSIVIVAFNRPNSLKTLLKSLNKMYCSENIRLIISIDYSVDNDEVKKIADEFKWIHGEKLIIKHIENLGLKKHVLFCGDLTQKYGNLCVLEDDLIVSPNLVDYCSQVLDSYSLNSDIAGFSLYTHRKNIENVLPFYPLKSENDVFLLQYAMSWGQLWTVDQWNSFRQWFDSENDDDFNKSILPTHLSKWSNKSWLKYHIKYCIEKNKFFVYPYYSLTTNSSEVGTHSKKRNTDFQVPLQYSISNKVNYKLGNYSELEKYDAFFENMLSLKKFLNNELSLKNVLIDIYGEKDIIGSKYILTTKVLNYTVIKSFSLELKPVELNILFNIPGEDIFLYDMSKPSKTLKKDINKLNKNLYYFGNIPKKYLVEQLINKIGEKIQKK